MDKVYLKKIRAYLINEHEDGYFLTDGQGYILESEDLIDIGKNLIKFAKKHKNDIIETNKKTTEELRNFLKDYIKTPKPKPSGQIYIMECGGYYKIGVSKNVKRRQKELDRRPFKVNIIYESKIVEDCYSVEEMLHNRFSQKRINGEWFNLNNNDIEIIKTILEEL